MSERLWGRIAVGLTVALAIAASANSLANRFAYDDVHIVEENKAIRSLDNLPELVTEPYWPERRGGAALHLYRPVTLATLATDWSLWDGRPFGFHLTNLLLHGLATALLAWLLLRFAGPWGALVGGALFAVHPVHTETVANVVGRAEILVAVFAFAALLVASGARAQPQPRLTPTGPALAAGALYLLAILSKESAVMLPAFLFLIDGARERWTSPGEIWRYVQRRYRVYLFLALAAVLAFLARWEVLGTPVGSDRTPTLGHDPDYAARFFTMIRVWPEYLRLLLVPFDLSADYSPAVLLPARSWTPVGLVAFLVVALLLALGFALWRRAPLVSAGVFWVPVALFPVSNLLILTGVLLAERTLYVPSAGLSIVAAGLVPFAMRSGRARRLGLAGVVMLTGVYTVATVRRNPVWRDTDTVFAAVLRAHPESYKAQWALAYRLATRGLWEEAERGYREAIDRWPSDDRLWGDLTTYYVGRGEWRKAEVAAREARALNPWAPTPHHLLTLSLVNQKRWRDAVIAAHEGLAAMGDDALLYNLLARAREGLGQDHLAADALRASLALAEGDWSAWSYLARLYGRAGDPAAAGAALDSAEARAVGDPAAGRAIAALRDTLTGGP